MMNFLEVLMRRWVFITSLAIFSVLVSGCDSEDIEALEAFFESYDQHLTYPDEVNTDCSDQYNNKRTIVRESLTLPSGCVLNNAEFYVVASNVVMNGNGVVIRNDDSISTAIMILSKPDALVRDVEVFGFQVKGGRYGIRPHRNLIPDEIQRTRDNPEMMIPLLQETATQHVYIHDNVFVEQIREGLYVWIGSHNVRFENNRIYGARRGTCAYITSATRDNVIRGNHFEGCGFVGNDGLPRIRFEEKREGLAIDGSTGNLVELNTFKGNAHQGIALYKNCGEYHTTDNTFIPRLNQPNQNVIRDNVFENNGDDVSIEIGDRIDTERSGKDCADPVYLQSGGDKWYLDNPQLNTVTGNKGGKILVKGDNNTVINNQAKVIVGSSVRDRAGFPVVGNVVSGNLP